MARRPRKPRLNDYQPFRDASGWYLAAWRDHKGLTLEDLAAEVGTSKGVVSDLETGALKANGSRAQRFNADDVDKYARALGVQPGHLLDVNPFTADLRWLSLSSEFPELDDFDKDMVAEMVARLRAKAAK